ncbi:MAG: AI-2E family transporter [Chloroflexota bacterium]|nr:AI-2E family transporter [Chloroflexota bacterium]
MAKEDAVNGSAPPGRGNPPGTGAGGAGTSLEGSHPVSMLTSNQETRAGMLTRIRGQLQRVVPPRERDRRPVDTFVEPIDEEAIVSPDIAIEVAKWTRRRDIPLAILAWAAVVLLALYLTSYISKTILLLVVAALLAYALAPLVGFLERVMPRLLAVLVVYLVVLTGIIVLVYFIVRTAVDQVSSLSKFVGTLLTAPSKGQLTPLEHTLGTFGISPGQISSARDQIIKQLEGFAGSIVPLLTGIADAVLNVLLVTILSIYLLLDGSRVSSGFRRAMPRSQRGRVRFLFNTLQQVVGGYIRGQLFLCALIGMLVGIGMQVIGVPYAILLGVFAFVLEFIPILGTLVSGAVCVLLALTKGPLVALIVLVYFIFVHIIEGDIVGPRIVGKAVGLHPVVSIVALIAGSELFGIWGALFASPVAGVLQSLLVAVWTEWREAHPNQFQSVKQKATETVASTIADKSVKGDRTEEPAPVDEDEDEDEPPARLLSLEPAPVIEPDSLNEAEPLSYEPDSLDKPEPPAKLLS